MKKILLFLFVALLAACYSPERYEADGDSKGESSRSDFGTLFEVNGGHQICNPSVTMDEKIFLRRCFG